MEKVSQSKKRLFFCLILIILILVIFELLTRILINFSPFLQNLNPPLMIEDPVLEHRHIPGIKTISVSPCGEYRVKVTVNQNGLRDRDIPYHKEKVEKRILILGDSFPEGIQVLSEETYPKVLESLIQEKESNHKYTVINAGVAGYSTIHEYLFLKTETIKYDPDIIILSFFMNDVSENHRFRNIFQFSSSGEPVKVKESTSKTKIIPLPLKLFLKKHSRLMVVISKLYYLLQGSRKSELTKDRIGNLQYDRFAINRIEQCNNYDEDWKFTLDLINRINEISKMHKSKFILLIIPLGAQVSPDEWEDVNKFEKLSYETMSDYPQIILNKFCSENNIHCIDLLPSFKNNHNEILYFHNNGHFNPKGHSKTAEIILDYLLINKLL